MCAAGFGTYRRPLVQSSGRRRTGRPGTSKVEVWGGRQGSKRETLSASGALRTSTPCVSSKGMWSHEYERRAAEMRHRNDRLAARLGHEHLRIAEATPSTGALERHYTVKEIGAVWRLSASSITRIFRDEPGVLKIGCAQSRRGRRSHTTLRIPESVVQRVYLRLLVR